METQFTPSTFADIDTHEARQEEYGYLFGFIPIHVNSSLFDLYDYFEYPRWFEEYQKFNAYKSKYPNVVQETVQMELEIDMKKRRDAATAAALAASNTTNSTRQSPPINQSIPETTQHTNSSTILPSDATISAFYDHPQSPPQQQHQHHPENCPNCKKCHNCPKTSEKELLDSLLDGAKIIKLPEMTAYYGGHLKEPFEPQRGVRRGFENYSSDMNLQRKELQLYGEIRNRGTTQRPTRMWDGSLTKMPNEGTHWEGNMDSSASITPSEEQSNGNDDQNKDMNGKNQQNGEEIREVSKQCIHCRCDLGFDMNGSTLELPDFDDLLHIQQTQYNNNINGLSALEEAPSPQLIDSPHSPIQTNTLPSPGYQAVLDGGNGKGTSHSASSQPHSPQHHNEQQRLSFQTISPTAEFGQMCPPEQPNQQHHQLNVNTNLPLSPTHSIDSQSHNSSSSALTHNLQSHNQLILKSSSSAHQPHPNHHQLTPQKQPQQSTTLHNPPVLSTPSSSTSSHLTPAELERRHLLFNHPHHNSSLSTTTHSQICFKCATNPYSTNPLDVSAEAIKYTTEHMPIGQHSFTEKVTTPPYVNPDFYEFLFFTWFPRLLLEFLVPFTMVFNAHAAWMNPAGAWNAMVPALMIYSALHVSTAHVNTGITFILTGMVGFQKDWLWYVLMHALAQLSALIVAHFTVPGWTSGVIDNVSYVIANTGPPGVISSGPLYYNPLLYLISEGLVLAIIAVNFIGRMHLPDSMVSPEYFVATGVWSAVVNFLFRPYFHIAFDGWWGIYNPIYTYWILEQTNLKTLFMQIFLFGCGPWVGGFVGGSLCRLAFELDKLRWKQFGYHQVWKLLQFTPKRVRDVIYTDVATNEQMVSLKHQIDNDFVTFVRNLTGMNNGANNNNNNNNTQKNNNNNNIGKSIGPTSPNQDDKTVYTTGHTDETDGLKQRGTGRNHNNKSSRKNNHDDDDDSMGIELTSLQ